jgi:hypothetical protein
MANLVTMALNLTVFNQKEKLPASTFRAGLGLWLLQLYLEAMW